MVALLQFCFRILASKMLIFQVFLWKNHSLREKCPYSELFWSVFSRIRTKYGKIRTRITPNTDTFYAVIAGFIQWEAALTLPEYIVEQGMNIPKSREKQWITWVAPVHFCFEIIASKMLIFEARLPLQRTIGGYFWKNAYTHFQKICSLIKYGSSEMIAKLYNWTSYEYWEVMSKTLITLDALLCFCFRIIASKFSIF